MYKATHQFVTTAYYIDLVQYRGARLREPSKLISKLKKLEKKTYDKLCSRSFQLYNYAGRPC